MLRTGMGPPIAQRAFAEAGSAIVRYTLRTGQSHYLAISIGGRQSALSALYGRATELLGGCRLSPHELMLDIPEAALRTIDDDSLQQVHALRRDGVRLAVDDFGAGPTSLSLLEGLPISDLRLSRRLTACRPGSDSAATLAALSRLAADRGFRCTAIGIETEEQVDRALSAGVGYGQGPLLGEPLASLPPTS
jgi:EAL domain-containing protein (putative c-di-GMP-specific phosphodiesterase class I)